MLTRAAGIVIGGFERDHATGALRQAVQAEQRAAERAQRRLEHRRGDRSGAVGDRAQSRVVALGGSRHGGQHLQHRGHQHRVGHALPLEDVEHALRLELAHQDGRRPVPEAAVRPADPADVEHRQRREAHGALVERPAQRRLRGDREVGVRGEDALGDPGRARGVHLDDDVARLAAVARVARLVCREPALVVLAHDDQARRRREPFQHVLGDLAVPRPGDQQRRLCVCQHRAELRWREPPVERHEHCADLARGEQQLDDLRGGAVEIRDARPGPGAVREQRLREPVRALVEMRVRDLALTVPERHGLRALRRVATDDVRDAHVGRRLAHRASRKNRVISSSTSGCSVEYR